MKLRYYLRGLGIGMVVTAILMGVALKDGQPLSDAEIRVRAMELGMVDRDSRTLADNQAPQEPGEPSSDVPSSAVAPEESPEVTSALDPAATAGAPEESPEITSTPDPATTATPTVAPTESPDLPLKPLPMVTPKPSQTASPDPISAGVQPPAEGMPEQPETVTFVVSSGQSSYTVSKSLVEAGLVEDASEFDRYLEENGYSKRISTGTYEIPLGSTQEEIAKIITRSR